MSGATRRAFLTSVGWLGGALALWPAGATMAARTRPEPLMQVRIASDGSVTIVVGKLEMGQGATTGLAMLVAEEMDADWARVRVELGPAHPRFVDQRVGMQVTGGSHSIRHQWQPLRELGAHMRSLLVRAAAARWQVAPHSLRTARSHVVWGTRRLSYAALREDIARLPVLDSVPLKSPAEFRLIGKPLPRADAEGKLRGHTRFGMDLPAARVAVVARPPRWGGRVQAWSAEPVRAAAGCDAFEIGLDHGMSGVAVVGPDLWTVLSVRQQLQVRWTDPAEPAQGTAAIEDAFIALSRQPGRVARALPSTPLPPGGSQLESTWVLPYLPHAAMEPRSCVVDLRADACEVWTGTQFQTVDHAAICRTVALPAERVVLHTVPAGGAFGRRATATSDTVVEACHVALSCRQRGLHGPVKVVWTREDDMTGGYYRPMHVHHAQVVLDAAARPVRWLHRVVGQSLLAGTPFEGGIAPNGVDGASTEGLADTPYALPLHLEVHHPRTAVPVLWWRSVGHSHTAFVVETLIDELAERAGVDPAAYRTQLLPVGHKLHETIRLATAASGWGRDMPAGEAQGLAVHECFGTAVAYVVRVALERGQLRVLQVTAAVHCGLVVNPSSARAQVEGAAIMALGTLLPGGELVIGDDGVVDTRNFDRYRMPRMADVPRIEVHFVPSADPPTGLGEPGLPPFAPAVANAVSRLTGTRVRRLPLRLGAGLGRGAMAPIDAAAS